MDIIIIKGTTLGRVIWQDLFSEVKFELQPEGGGVASRKGWRRAIGQKGVPSAREQTCEAGQ